MNARLTRIAILVVVILTMAAVSLVSAQGNPVRRPTISRDLQADIQHYAPAALTAEERQAILGMPALEHVGAAAISAQERQADIRHYAPAALTPEERDAILGHTGFAEVSRDPLLYFGPDADTRLDMSVVPPSSSRSLPPRRR